jgi:hypothetical protein
MRFYSSISSPQSLPSSPLRRLVDTLFPSEPPIHAYRSLLGVSSILDVSLTFGHPICFLTPHLPVHTPYTPSNSGHFVKFLDLLLVSRPNHWLVPHTPIYRINFWTSHQHLDVSSTTWHPVRFWMSGQEVDISSTYGYPACF